VNYPASRVRPPGCDKRRGAALSRLHQAFRPAVSARRPPGRPGSPRRGINLFRGCDPRQRLRCPVVRREQDRHRRRRVPDPGRRTGAAAWSGTAQDGLGAQRELLARKLSHLSFSRLPQMPCSPRTALAETSAAPRSPKRPAGVSAVFARLAAGRARTKPFDLPCELACRRGACYQAQDLPSYGKPHYLGDDPMNEALTVELENIALNRELYAKRSKPRPKSIL
jgi:hypothetical protein